MLQIGVLAKTIQNVASPFLKIAEQFHRGWGHDRNGGHRQQPKRNL